jgi:hypothetical protein
MPDGWRGREGCTYEASCEAHGGPEKSVARPGRRCSAGRSGASMAGSSGARARLLLRL